MLVWIIASVGFGFYVAHFSSYNKTYGSLAGVIVFLLWLWITNLALLFGAEIDSEIERGRQLQAGIKAEEDTPTSSAGHQGQRQDRRQGREGTCRGPRHPRRRRNQTREQGAGNGRLAG